MSEQFCPHCMKSLDGMETFCPECGHSVEANAVAYHLPAGRVFSARPVCSEP